MPSIEPVDLRLVKPARGKGGGSAANEIRDACDLDYLLPGPPKHPKTWPLDPLWYFGGPAVAS